MQLATSGDSRSQAGGNEADRDKGKDDRDDGKIDATAVKLIVSRVYDGHLAWVGVDSCGVRQVLEGGRCEHRQRMLNHQGATRGSWVSKAGRVFLQRAEIVSCMGDEVR